MQKTLGGDRLGSGKKMKVDLHGFGRSTHDMGYLWRSSAAPGTLIPFLCELALPGDTFDINLNADVKTHPSLGPLFGSFKLQLDLFQAPIRLYQALLHNNKLGIGMEMQNVLLPQIQKAVPPVLLSGWTTPVSDIDNAQINPSALLSYLGIRGFGTHIAASAGTTIDRFFNAVPYLAYWEIYKNYYSNKQEEDGAYIHTTLVANPNNVTQITYYDDNNTGGITIDDGTGTNPPIASFGNNVRFELGYTAPALNILDWVMLLFRDSNGNIITTPWNELMLGGSADDGSGLITGTLGNSYPLGYELLSWRYRNQSDMWNSPPQIVRFPLDNIDQMRENILAAGSSQVNIDYSYDPPYGPPLLNINDVPATLSSQEGLGLKTYQSDLFNNWLNTDWIDGTTGINAITAIDTSGGSFTLDTLLLSRKVYDMLNRIAVSGGSYDDWLDAQYAHERYTRCESPMYHGGLSKEIVFQEVISNSSTGDQPLGTLAGRGVMSNKHKGGKSIIRVDEPSYIIGIVSITPRLDYSQGNKWDTQLKTMNDLHVPSLDEIGFQELLTEQMTWWDTQWNDTNNTWQTFSAGKQPAWINYMTNVNQTRGNFAVPNNEMFMTLNRRWNADQSAIVATGAPVSVIEDLTTYIDPSKYNFIFAETALDAQNFWLQISVDMEARRKMSNKVMPNL